MTLARCTQLLILLAASGWNCGLGFAQDTSAATSAPASDTRTLAADLKLERATLREGTKYEGLVQAESPETVEFLEVRRLPGRPMYLMLRPLAREDIQDLERLPADAQAELRERLEQFRRRTLIQGREIDDLELTSKQQSGQTIWNHAGAWFTLESTANEQMTRRLGVRLGQIFTAYRQLLPPRREASDRVHIRIFGSTAGYQAALKQLGFVIGNPAVYLADRNLILAGTELDRFDAELARVARQHEQIRKELEAQIAEVPVRVKKLGEELEAAGVGASERLRIVLAEQRKWSDQRKALASQIAAIDRANEAKFNELTQRMFTRLAHEAFHAYLETDVYPSQQYDVPRWLNEGLAQVFEAGILELDSLRIDAPNLDALEKLQADLRGSQPLRLEELLTMSSSSFLAAHGDVTRTGPERSSRAYYYSWGLAYYLAFERGIFDDPAFETYISSAAANEDPVKRFESLVGMPLAEFEETWRAAMLAIR
jgi:hypothetical protein